MNFIYICRDGENEELRYSIRSVLKFYPEARIEVFGGKPSWYSGPYTEINDFGNKFDNIKQCYKAICATSIDSFILMNDDFYLLKRVGSFCYYDNLLEDKIMSHTNRYGLSKYARVLMDANKQLKRMGIDQPLNYDIHTPMYFDTSLLSKIIDLSDAPRSMYGNIYSIGGENISDVKIYKDTENISISEYFLSSEDNSFIKIMGSLKNLLPEPSIYESPNFITDSI